MNVRIDSPYFLDDPTFLTKVKLIFNCVICKKSWSTYQGTIKCRFSVVFNTENELQFNARVYKQKCKTCQGWGLHRIQYLQKVKVANAMGD